MSRADFKAALAAAEKKRKGISDTPAQVQAIDIAKTLPDAEGSTTTAHDAALPPLMSASQIHPSRIVTPPLLVENLLHREAKMILAGGSKTYKSWSLVDLGLSVASGTPWWGLRCAQGVVVYLNFELIQGFLEWRIHYIMKAKKITPPPWFLYWNLRNKCYNLSTVGNVLRARIAAMRARVDIIIVDPIYKALGGLDENSAGDMTTLMQSVEELSAETGAAIIFGAHFSKGAQAQKEAKDRISGSGVFGRDPDSILTMTRHKTEQSYVVESDLRYVAPLSDFVVSWRFPLMHIDEGKDPRDLWIPGQKREEKEEKETPISDDDILTCLTHGGMQDGMWREQVKIKFGKAGNAYYTAKKRLLEQGRVIKHGLKYLPTAFGLAVD